MCNDGECDIAICVVSIHSMLVLCQNKLYISSNIFTLVEPSPPGHIVEHMHIVNFTIKPTHAV